MTKFEDPGMVQVGEEVADGAMTATTAQMQNAMKLGISLRRGKALRTEIPKLPT